MTLSDLLAVTNDIIHIHKKKAMPFPDKHIVTMSGNYRVLSDDILNSQVTRVTNNSNYKGLVVYLDIFDNKEE